ncbi:hypothetical protein [Geminicoccus harenae]|uniref:hypothetical protein n=1 Tax=Geminicoccus harenae TaxID=2498453 RepID=UPI00168C04EE|nr:hypothetical protein [Geminicoccus harenae]
MRSIPWLIIAMSFAAVPSMVQAQGVDYHKAQQAGKVWERKQAENNRNQARSRQTSVNSEGIAYNAPLSMADREEFLAANRPDYDRLVQSVGRKNADRWLEMRARQERSKR